MTINISGNLIYYFLFLFLSAIRSRWNIFSYVHINYKNAFFCYWDCIIHKTESIFFLNWISPEAGWKIAQAFDANCSKYYGTSTLDPENYSSSSGLAMGTWDFDMKNFSWWCWENSDSNSELPRTLESPKKSVDWLVQQFWGTTITIYLLKYLSGAGPWHTQKLLIGELIP